MTHITCSLDAANLIKFFIKSKKKKREKFTYFCRVKHTRQDLGRMMKREKYLFIFFISILNKPI